MPYNDLNPATATLATSIIASPAKLTSVGETLLTLRTDLKLMLGTRADVADPDGLNAFINKGYRTVWDMIDVPQQHLTVAFPLEIGTYLYKIIPAANQQPLFAWIERLSVSDSTHYLEGGRSFRKIDLSIYRKLDELTDEPTSFFEYNGCIVIWPTPKTALSVFIDGKWDLDTGKYLSANNDSPFLSYEWHEAILLAARWKALRNLRDFSAAATAQNDFVSYIRPILDKYAEQKSRGDTMARMQPIRSIKEYFRRRA